MIGLTASLTVASPQPSFSFHDKIAWRRQTDRQTVRERGREGEREGERERERDLLFHEI